MKNKKAQSLPISSLDILEIIKIGVAIALGYIIIKALLSAMN